MTTFEFGHKNVKLLVFKEREHKILQFSVFADKYFCRLKLVNKSLKIFSLFERVFDWH